MHHIMCTFPMCSPVYVRFFISGKAYCYLERMCFFFLENKKPDLHQTLEYIPQMNNPRKFVFITD